MDASENEQIATGMFGWKWIAYDDGIPVKGTPGYPKRCRVRILMSPETRRKKDWKDFLSTRNASEATGSEPLDYCYCSSKGYEVFPNYTGWQDPLVLERAKRLWKRRDARKWKAFCAALPDEITDYKIGDFSRAALSVLQGDDSRGE